MAISGPDRAKGKWTSNEQPGSNASIQALQSRTEDRFLALLMHSWCPVILCVPNDSLSLLCRGSSHPLDALPAYPVRPSSQSPVQDLGTAYSGKKGRRHAKRQP